MQNLNHSIYSQVSFFHNSTENFLHFVYLLAKQQALLFHLSNLTPRLNKVVAKSESVNKKSKKNEQVETLSSLVSLRNDLVELLTTEFKESAKHNKQFSFNVSFTNPLDKILIKTSSAWTPSHCYISSGSFNTDKNTPAFSQSQRQFHYFANGGLTKVNRLEIR